VSFVNGISTYRGGQHVSYILDQIANKIITILKSKHKNVSLKPSHVKDHLSIFIDCIIEDPAFDSQTKEFMTSKTSDFGSTCELSDSFIKKIMTTGLAEEVLRFAKFKQTNELT